MKNENATETLSPMKAKPEPTQTKTLDAHCFDCDPRNNNSLESSRKAPVGNNPPAVDKQSNSKQLKSRRRGVVTRTGRGTTRRNTCASFKRQLPRNLFVYALRQCTVTCEVPTSGFRHDLSYSGARRTEALGMRTANL